jgi:tRNA wybutosine-synthesizing protein 2
MKPLKSLLSESINTPEDKKQFLPSGFQQVGDIVILSLKHEAKPYSKQIAGFILDKFPRFKTVCLKADSIKGELRKPSVKVIAGENRTVTTHKESNCLYRIDVSKVMFSQGNLSERRRLPKLVRPGEVIVDMFAGIGYFSIPIAKSARPRRIYAIDKNPDSIALLKENIRLNHVEGVIKTVLGDCRSVVLGEKADRIIMGYLPGTSEFLPAAFGLLKPHGIIHYHDTFRTGELWKRPEEVLRSAAEKAGFSLKITRRAVVKHYAPKVEHIVIDAELSSSESTTSS